MDEVQVVTKRGPDVSDRYRLTRSSFDLIGVFGSLQARVVPGPVLVRVLAEHGYSASSVHNQLVRLVDRGMLTARRRGRVTLYGLGDPVVENFFDIRGERADRGYGGRFHSIVYAIPERSRRLRDRFQYIAGMLGYRQLRPGVLIGILDRSEELAGMIDLSDDDGWYECGHFAPDSLVAAQRIAESAFGLADALRTAGKLEARVDALDAGGSRPGSGRPELGLSEFFDLYFVVARAVMEHPLLPRDLVGGSQPAERFRTLMDRCNREYSLRFDERIRQSAAESSSFELVEFLPDPALPTARTNV